MISDLSAVPVASQPAEGAAKFRDLRTRLLSSLVLAPLVLAAVYVGGWPFQLAAAAVAAVLAWEWVHLRGLVARRWPGALIPLVLVGACIAASVDSAALAITALAAGFVLALAAAPRRGRVGAGRRWLAAGVPYIGIGCVALNALREDASAGLGNVVFLIAVVWASDIGAYLAGRLVGGPKLAPRISPSKTWAGAIGGLVAAFLAGLLVARAFDGGQATGALLAAAILGALAQAGDLLESWIKRTCNVKDASGLIPGHGGLLDRMDGILAAAPAAALMALMLGDGAAIWHLAG